MDDCIKDRNSWRLWFENQATFVSGKEKLWYERILWEDVVVPLLIGKQDISTKELDPFLERLRRGEPLACVSGRTYFYGIPFQVGPGVLIPRPETEELVAWILEDHSGERLSILDIGSGSGVIPIVLKKKRPDWKVYAMENSLEAIRIAEKNGQLNQVPIEWIHEDLFATEALRQVPKMDLIVSNPPYIRDSERHNMSTSTLNFEPEEALFVRDHDPLLYYREILKVADAMEASCLYLELNEFLTEIYQEWVAELSGWTALFRSDLQGKTRMLRLRKATT